MTEEQKLAEAREICAKDCEARGLQELADEFRAKFYDETWGPRIALAALNRGIEIGKGEA